MRSTSYGSGAGCQIAGSELGRAWRMVGDPYRAPVGVDSPWCGYKASESRPRPRRRRGSGIVGAALLPPVGVDPRPTAEGDWPPDARKQRCRFGEVGFGGSMTWVGTADHGSAATTHRAKDRAPRIVVAPGRSWSPARSRRNGPGTRVPKSVGRRSRPRSPAVLGPSATAGHPLTRAASNAHK